MLKSNVLYTDRRLVKEICSPLSKINTFGFVFVRHLKDGKFVYLSNDLEWPADYFLHRFMEGKYSTSEIYQLFIADGVDLWSLNQNNLIWQEGEKHFGIGNGISLYFKHKDFIDIFCFFTKKDYGEMSEFYINSLELLKQFSHYFLKEAQPLIEYGIHHNPFSIPKIYDSNLLFDQSGQAKKLKHEFLMAIDPVYQRVESGEKITERELACIQQCATGKSAKQVADQLFLSRRTVETHLNNAKFKLGCANLSELIAVVLKYGSFF